MWVGSLKKEIAQVFASAQRMRNQVIDRVSDEDQIDIAPRVERVAKANRRIVKGREG